MKRELLIIALGAVASLASCSEVRRAKVKQEVSTWECTEVTTSTAITTSTSTSTAWTTTTTTTATETTTTESTTTTQTTATIATATEPEITTEVTTAEETVCGGDINYVEPLSGYWDSTWYAATSMGYTSQPYGASGNLLVSGYSVASDYFAFGTLLYIESEYMTGVFRVDDCGVGSSNTVDFYFWDSSEVPAGFRQAGRVPITIVPIEQ